MRKGEICFLWEFLKELQCRYVKPGFVSERVDEREAMGKHCGKRSKLLFHAFSPFTALISVPSVTTSAFSLPKFKLLSTNAGEYGRSWCTTLFCNIRWPCLSWLLFFRKPKGWKLFNASYTLVQVEKLYSASYTSVLQYTNITWKGRWKCP